MMKLRESDKDHILQPCGLEMFKYQIDPYIGCEHHCLYCYTLNDYDVEKHGEIITYKNIEKRLSEEISNLEPQTIYIGMDTDPYQPCERVHQQTRKILSLLAKHHFSVSILTKSDLIVRDIDLLTGMIGPSAGVSITFHEEDTRKLFEPDAPPNESRVKALQKLTEAGIETYTLITPIMPFITDAEKIIKMIAPHSDSIWFYALDMKSETDQNWLNIKRILDRHFFGLTEEYKEIVFSKNHPYWTGLRQKLEGIKKKGQRKLRIEL